MLSSDLKYASRWLFRQKASTALVVTMLALGIAANVVAFSLVNGLFLRPFPFQQPDRLVYVNATAPRWDLEIVGINYPDFVQWRENTKLLEAIGIWNEVAFNLSDGTGAERINGAQVTYDFPAALRITPVLGRTFTREEDTPNGPPVVLIGEGLWRERFGGTRDVLGRTLKLNGVAHTIVGVLPPAAAFPGEVRLWVPLAGDPAQPGQTYGYDGAIGRLKPGATVGDAERDLHRAHQPIWDAQDRERVVSPVVRPLREHFSRGFRNRASTLFGATVILMIVACANVASVMLARALLRRREIGIRLAVGASRGRVTRQLFIENLLLSIAGGAAGLTLGAWSLGLLLSAAGDQIPRWASFALDWRTATFTIVLTILTTLLFGWAPALHAAHDDPRRAIETSGTGSTVSPRGRRTLSTLVAAEFALAAVLIVSGGLLLRAYERVQHVAPGFRVDGVLTFALALPEAAYGDRKGDAPGTRSIAFWERLLDRMKALPGVESAAVISCLPLTCHWGNFYDIEGRAPLAPGQTNPVTLYRPVTPGYFEAMGIRLERGRFFTGADGRGEALSVIVNETFVKTFWPGVEDPVGRRIRRPTRPEDPPAPWITVVGLVEDVKHYGLEQPMRPGLYLPIHQEPSTTMTVVMRTVGDPMALMPAARGVVNELDPDLPLYRVRSMEDVLRSSLTARRTYAWLLGVFALITLMLALGGAYGVTSYLVSQRTREFGIRLALGARTVDVARAVIRSTVPVVVTGIIVGLGLSVVLGRWMGDLLFEVVPHDPVVLGVASAILLVFAAATNAVPALRAARVDPIRTLRAE